MEANIGKCTWRWFKKHFGTRFFCIANNCQRSIGYTMGISLFMDLAIASNSQAHTGRQRIYHRYTYTVQTTRNLITVVIKLTTGMQNGHNNFGSRDTLIMHFCRNTATIIRNGDGFVWMNNHPNFRTVTG